jgi:hypothetical protein
MQALPTDLGQKEGIRWVPGLSPEHSADFSSLRITPLSYMECNQAASGLDLNPQTFTRSKSDAAIIAHEMPIMRTKSSSEVLGQRESSEWDDSYAMETTTAVNKRSIMGVVGQVNVLNPPHMIKGAKLDRNASPYIKVLCRFSNGENEVPLSIFNPHRYYDVTK